MYLAVVFENKLDSNGRRNSDESFEIPSEKPWQGRTLPGMAGLAVLLAFLVIAANLHTSCGGKAFAGPPLSLDRRKSLPAARCSVAASPSALPAALRGSSCRSSVSAGMERTIACVLTFQQSLKGPPAAAPRCSSMAAAGGALARAGLARFEEGGGRTCNLYDITKYVTYAKALEWQKVLQGERIQHKLVNKVGTVLFFIRDEKWFFSIFYCRQSYVWKLDER